MLSSHQSAQQAASAVLTKGLRMLQEQCMHTTISLAPVATSARAASRNATPDAGVTLPSMDAFSFSPSDIEVEPVDLCCPASTPRSALTSAFTQLRQSDLAAEAAQVASALADHLAHQQMATLTAFNLVGSPSGYRQQQHQQPN